MFICLLKGLEFSILELGLFGLGVVESWLAAGGLVYCCGARWSDFDC